jgi:LPXTG-motif cell wall-anchored protein
VLELHEDIYYAKTTDAEGNVTEDEHSNFDPSKTNAAWGEVENNKGTLLPSTGGIGTTIFYVVGGVLVLAAIILLVTKKRMSE